MADRIDVAVSGNEVWFTFSLDSHAGTLVAYKYRYSSGTNNLAPRGNFVVPSEVTGLQLTPVVEVRNDGNFVFEWQDGTGVEFRPFTPDGTALDATDQIVADTGAVGSDPELLAMANGGFLFVYTTASSGFLSPAQVTLRSLTAYDHLRRPHRQPA